jgi:glycosyltransferase involved in cell wall biosynthesis
MSATVIIPTTGSPEVIKCIESVVNQTYHDVTAYVVIDGMEHFNETAMLLLKHKLDDHPRVKICTLPTNVGAKGFYGHRIYAGFTHLVNTKYVLYLDQDNWFDEDHVETCVKNIETRNLDWCYSLRTICDKDGNQLVNDNCESLGKWPVFSGDYHHIDTNCYCIRTEVAIKLAQVWHGGWGQDRHWYSALSQYFTKFDTTSKYTVNYRLAGNEGSVKKEFFEHGNNIMNRKYNGAFPWLKI